MVEMNRIKTAADSQSATVSSVMVASLNEPVSIKLAIGPFAGSHKRINDRLPLCHFVSIPMWSGLAVSHNRCNETEMTMLQFRRFIHG
jgi:hypothetical protein